MSAMKVPIIWRAEKLQEMAGEMSVAKPRAARVMNIPEAWMSLTRFILLLRRS